MSPLRRVLPFLSILLAAGEALAAGQVDLDIFTDERVPVTGPQEWAQRLSEAGIPASIHGKRGSEKVGVEVRGTPQAPVYAVTGMLTSGNELVLPGGRFRLGEAAAAARWLKDLAQKGLAEKLPERAGFGLTAEQIEQVRKELAQPAGGATQGKDRAEVAARLAGQLVPPLRLGAEAVEAMKGDPVAEEVSSLSLGTALACVLRPAGYCLVPREARPDRVEFAIVSSKETREPWPVGWSPEKPLPEILPAIYESFNANVQGVPVSRVLDAVGKRLKTPVLLDHNALARHGVEAEKAIVNAPQARTTYNSLLRKVLSQAKLKYEVRVDEAGTPLLWVSTQRPI